MPDNINPHAQSKESAKKPGDITTYSINEPGPGDPVAFKVPEDHTATTPETLEQAYPEGYVAPAPYTIAAVEADDSLGNDPDELEDEIDQAKEEGDFKSPYKPTHKTPAKRK